MLNTCTEIILHPDYNLQEACEGGNIIYDSKPISWWKEEGVEGDGPIRKRRRRISPDNIDDIIQKDFSLLELYKCNNIEELNLPREKGDTTLDTDELLRNLKGWTVEKKTRQEKNGKYSRVDKSYLHPMSRKMLRSIVAVRKFIEEKSYLRKASDNGEGSSQGVNLSDDGSVRITASEDMMTTP